MTEEIQNADPLGDMFDAIISDDLTGQFQTLCDKFVSLCHQQDLVTEIDMTDFNKDEEPNFIYFGDEDCEFVVSVNVFSEKVQTNECQLSFGGFENDIKKKIIAQMEKIFASLTAEQTFYVDIPQLGKEEWISVETFDTRAEAIAYAQKNLGADENGMVSLISVS
jgi:hypothetical protein